MKMPLISLSIGFLLTFFSLQNVLVKNVIFNLEMNTKYKITELNAMYKGIPTNYTFGGRTINTWHTLLDKPHYKDPWGNVTFLGDIFITVDGEKLATLKSFPVEILKGREPAEGLNQYGSFVSYWLIQDNRTKEEMFSVVIQTTREVIRNMNDYIPNDEQEYKMITISKDGSIKTEKFSFENKSKLQTKLLPYMDEGEVDYYSSKLSNFKIDLPDAFTFLYFAIYPLFYPFFTLISGLLLFLVSSYIIIKHWNIRKKIEHY